MAPIALVVSRNDSFRERQIVAPGYPFEAPGDNSADFKAIAHSLVCFAIAVPSSLTAFAEGPKRLKVLRILAIQGSHFAGSAALPLGGRCIRAAPLRC